MAVYIILQWIVTFILGLLVYLTFKTWRPFYFRKGGIPGPFPLPLFGNMIGLQTRGLQQYDMRAIRKYGRVFGTFEFGIPVLVVADLDILRQITSNQFKTFTNRRAVEGDEIATNMLMMLKDDDWRNVRHLLTPSFSPGKLKLMMTQINECSSVLVRNLGKVAEGSTIKDLKELCSAFTLDVIASTAFGIKIDSQEDPNSEFIINTRKAFKFSLLYPSIVSALFLPELGTFWSKLGIPFFPPDMTKFFFSIIDSIRDSRKADTTTRVDFIQLMLNAHKDSDETPAGESEGEGDTDHVQKTAAVASEKKGLTKIQILANGFIFFLAGFESTASTLGFLIYNLALNTDCQDKLLKELETVLENKEFIDYDVVSKMTYLEMCIMETLRLYPPAVRGNRSTKEDITLEGMTIPKGTAIAIPIYAIHHDPTLWPDPEKFDPERFTVENQAQHHPLQHIPFGAGPRQCIGMRLALLELKVAMARALQDFSFSRCAETQVPLTFLRRVPFLQAEHGIKVKVSRRIAKKL